jgi:hypothetical protein
MDEAITKFGFFGIVAYILLKDGFKFLNETLPKLMGKKKDKANGAFSGDFLKIFQGFTDFIKVDLTEDKKETTEAFKQTTMALNDLREPIFTTNSRSHSTHTKVNLMESVIPDHINDTEKELTKVIQSAQKEMETASKERHKEQIALMKEISARG